MSEIMRDTVVLQRRQNEIDDFDPSDTWVDVCHMRANVMPLRGNELEQARQINSHVTHRVSVRFSRHLHPSYRFKLCSPYGERVLNIEAVIDVNNEHRVADCMCTEDVTLTADQKRVLNA